MPIVGKLVCKIEVIPFTEVTSLVKVVRSVGRKQGDFISPAYVRDYMMDWHEFVSFMFHLYVGPETELLVTIR